MSILQHSTYRIIWKTTRRYIYITRTETRIIHEVLKKLCSDNANFMAILSRYIGGRVIIKVALFSRLFKLFGSFVGMLSLGNRFFVIFWWVNGKIIYYLFYGWISEYIFFLSPSRENIIYHRTFFFFVRMNKNDRAM